jgi:uncharacterized membrane protein YhhN
VKNKTVQFFSILFWILTFIDIVAIWYGFSNIHFLVKPLLIPSLILMLVFSKSGANNKWWLLTGLFFSFLGDVFLLYEYKAPLFFIFGLASFLITHVCYIIWFVKIKSLQKSLLRQQPWVTALVAGYGCSLILLLYPGLGDLKIPVIIYAAVICFMLLCSLHVFYKTGRPSNVYFVTGALLFVVSDSLLAVNKFLNPFPLAGIFIMLTYCAAQFFIVMGFISNEP